MDLQGLSMLALGTVFADIGHVVIEINVLSRVCPRINPLACKTRIFEVVEEQMVPADQNP